MWLNNIKISEKKALSPIEFLVLASSISDEYQSAQDILQKINAQIEHWDGTPGTIYPILHRLKELKLLDQDTHSKLSFRTSEKGKQFFISTIRAFEKYYDSNRSFFVAIIRSFIRVDPILSQDVLLKFEEKTTIFRSVLADLKAEAEQVKTDENWSEVEVEFNDS